jgi:hypothetical protein
MLQKHKVMTPYADINGRSGIHSYASGDDFIKVQAVPFTSIHMPVPVTQHLKK